MIAKCQALIFDVDGTLPETDDLHRKAFNQTFQKWYLGWHWDFKIYKQSSEVSGGKEKLNYIYDPLTNLRYHSNSATNCRASFG